MTIPSDLNGGFKVGLTDLVILANAYGSSAGMANRNPNADIGNFGTVNLSDLVVMAKRALMEKNH